MSKTPYDSLGLLLYDKADRFASGKALFAAF
jgi:hypothetical protein